MNKRLVCMLFLCIFVLTLFPVQSARADYSEIPIYIDGELFTAPTVNVNGVTYVPIRAFSEALNPIVHVDWNEKDCSVTVSTPELLIKVKIGDIYMEANGRCLYLENGCIVVDGMTMVPLRALAKAFGASVWWAAGDRIIYVTRTENVIESGSSFYNSDELYWLSRIIYAESGGEPLEGMIAVGNVIFNRVDSKEFPDSIYDVIFDRRFGVTQFSPVSCGSIYNTPSDMSVIAAKLCMEGCNIAGDSLYFLNRETATNRWIVNNCTFVTEIGRHSFYC